MFLYSPKNIFGSGKMGGLDKPENPQQKAPETPEKEETSLSAPLADEAGYSLNDIGFGNEAVPELKKEEGPKTGYSINGRSFKAGEERKAFEFLLRSDLKQWVFANGVSCPFSEQFQAMLLGYFASSKEQKPEQAIEELESYEPYFAESHDFFSFIFMRLLGTLLYKDPRTCFTYAYETPVKLANAAEWQASFFLNHQLLVYLYLSRDRTPNLEAKEQIAQRVSEEIYRLSFKKLVVSLTPKEIHSFGSAPQFLESLANPDRFLEKNELLHRFFSNQLSISSSRFEGPLDTVFATAFRLSVNSGVAPFRENLNFYLQSHNELRLADGRVLRSDPDAFLSLAAQAKKEGGSTEARSTVLLYYLLLRQHVFDGGDSSSITNFAILANYAPEGESLAHLAQNDFDSFLDQLFAYKAPNTYSVMGHLYSLEELADALWKLPPLKAVEFAKSFNSDCLVQFAKAQSLQMDKESLLRELEDK